MLLVKLLCYSKNVFGPGYFVLYVYSLSLFISRTEHILVAVVRVRAQYTRHIFRLKFVSRFGLRLSTKTKGEKREREGGGNE